MTNVWVNAFIQGTVEGITEFLPVSSTGHLLLVEHALKKQESDLFNVVIQCGAVIAVLPLFPERLRQIFFRWREAATRDFIFKLLTAFAITGVGGLILDKLHFKLPENILPVALALLVGGLLFIAVEWWVKDKDSSDVITWKAAIAVGLAQLVAAVFPGTSRSGATIIAMLALSMSRPAATEFSFLVGIPTMLAAGGWKIFKELHHPAAGAPQEDWAVLLWCTAVSAVVSFVAVKWLLRYVQSHNFLAFAYYRIMFGCGLLWWLWDHA